MKAFVNDPENLLLSSRFFCIKAKSIRKVEEGRTKSFFEEISHIFKVDYSQRFKMLEPKIKCIIGSKYSCGKLNLLMNMKESVAGDEG